MWAAGVRAICSPPRSCPLSAKSTTDWKRRLSFWDFVPARFLLGPVNARTVFLGLDFPPPPLCIHSTSNFISHLAAFCAPPPPPNVDWGAQLTKRHLRKTKLGPHYSPPLKSPATLFPPLLTQQLSLPLPLPSTGVCVTVTVLSSNRSKQRVGVLLSRFSPLQGHDLP
ncbi:transcription factor 15-like [Platysternon megacephalum]|uniref:Transcription factor 15-like n=1 Tax=Platysternon megacephalum TaxID=55544 RepID=A0A4D9EJV4_9SAUR|nr:transcription factor 15-like [Platysternon megacephalum]